MLFSLHFTFATATATSCTEKIRIKTTSSLSSVYYNLFFPPSMYLKTFRFYHDFLSSPSYLLQTTATSIFSDQVVCVWESWIAPLRLNDNRETPLKKMPRCATQGRINHACTHTNKSQRVAQNTQLVICATYSKNSNHWQITNSAISVPYWLSSSISIFLHSNDLT